MIGRIMFRVGFGFTVYPMKQRRFKTSMTKFSKRHMPTIAD